MVNKGDIDRQSIMTLVEEIKTLLKVRQTCMRLLMLRDARMLVTIPSPLFHTSGHHNSDHKLAK
jgi:hypothetical protein